MALVTDALGANVKGVWADELNVVVAVIMCDTMAVSHVNKRERIMHARELSPDQPFAGFWIRLTAAALDVALLWGMTLAVVDIAAGMWVYLPFELLMVCLYLVYVAGCALLGLTTVGKMLCGIKVAGIDGRYAGRLRMILRETLAKLLSALPLFMGFLWMVFRRDRRTWHDLLTHTYVLANPRCRRAPVMLWVVLGSGAALVSLEGWDIGQAYRLVASMAPPADAKVDYRDNKVDELRPMATLTADDASHMAQWLDRQGGTPTKYLVACAKAHQVILLGDSELKKDELDFLNGSLPDLYHKAGVTRVAMEVCLAQDNDLLRKLVTGKDYNHALALRIARHQPWAIWGAKEYWDVLHTVWSINRSLAPGQKPMLVVGIDRPLDMPSLAMVGIESNAGADGPLWEKLRAFRVLRTLPWLIARDAFMARQIEWEIIEPGERGVVFVGRNHTFCSGPQTTLGGAKNARMGYLLRARYGPCIFQVRFHGFDIPVSAVDPSYQGRPPKMADFVEEVMQLRGKKPVGFDVQDSPLGLLRDEASFDYYGDGRIAFKDVAMGFIYLKNRRDLGGCTWLDSYISPEMFATYRPFYEAFARRLGKPIHSAAEANEAFRHFAE